MSNNKDINNKIFKQYDQIILLCEKELLKIGSNNPKNEQLSLLTIEDYSSKERISQLEKICKILNCVVHARNCLKIHDKPEETLDTLDLGKEDIAALGRFVKKRKAALALEEQKYKNRK